MILAKSFTSDPRKSAQLRSAIDAFGQASGLFTDIDIRRIGRKEGDPFQVQVKIAGSGINLVDVGYGVSQVLPIIVDAIREPPGSTFLLQQPEVHLHPRAQAELGSFLAALAKQQQKRFVVETHSDYLVDRIRMDIRDGKHLKPDDVAVLYFERLGGAAQVRLMEIDDFGNLVDVPPGYRQFFLEEERRMLGGYWWCVSSLMPTARFVFSRLSQKTIFAPFLIGCMLQIKTDVSYMAASWPLSYLLGQRHAVIYWSYREQAEPVWFLKTLYNLKKKLSHEVDFVSRTILT
jgi:AAA domain, putative AbiEii toxin, Type IV TA system